VRWPTTVNPSSIEQGIFMNFKKSTLAALAVVALGTVSTQASAYTWSSDTGTSSSFAGVTNINFESAPSGAVSNYAEGIATFNLGAIFNTSTSSITAQPAGATGNFWSVGTSGGQAGPGTVALSTAVKYYGFLWGSSDSYNTVTFSVFDGTNTNQVSLTGLAVPSGTGNQSVSRYLNFFAGSGETITGVSFASSQNAFETDNHAYSVTAVPEVETYAMMLAGLGLMGTIARRRNKSKAV
jgi:hypothetical protein